MTPILSPATRLWNLVREEKSDVTAIYFFAILSGLIQLTLPVGIQAIIGFVLGGTLSASLTLLICLLVLAVLATGIIQVNQMKVIERIRQRIFVRYAVAFADRIPKLDLKNVDGYYLPELVNRFFETVALQKGFAKLLLDLPIAVIQIVFGLLLLSLYHPFFILFGAAILILLWVILRTTGYQGLHTSLAESSFKYGLAGWLEEMARLVKSFKFSSGELHLKKADEKTISYLQARTKHFDVLVFQYRILIGFKTLITAGMLVGGVFLLLDQQINIGQFVAAEIIIITIIASIEKIITNLDSVYDVMTAVEKINKLIDKPVESGGSYKLEPAAPMNIQAKGLSFAYNDKSIIRNLGFDIKHGDKVCVTGEAGAGKSTLLRLLTGVYKDFDGQLLINGLPLANYDLSSLRERMGILFQHENIFHGTLWENLTMGRQHIDKTFLNELCVITGLHSFLASLPLGYDTELDPTGKRLPRNTVQKILLIRSLVHKPSLLILEDPLQGIEEHFQDAIQNLILSANDTTLVVATDDEMFANKCNQIIQLQKGKRMTTEFSSWQHIYRHNKKSRIRQWFYFLVLFSVVLMFLPWTQNIRAKGNVTTLRQEQRPQQINTIIGGKVEKWFVKEGDYVNKGDTILLLSEIKTDYLDPKLIERTGEQIVAKESSVQYYQNKIAATQDQIAALQATLNAKLNQVQSKLLQAEVKIKSDSAEVVAAENDWKIASVQYNRQRAMYDSGLVSLTQLETRNQAYQTAVAKKISAENKYYAARQERSILQIELSAVQQEYAEKVSKAEGDKYGSLSLVATGQGDIAKLQNQQASYAIRNGMYYVIAPQSGQIIKARTSGIGEVVKEGEMLVHIVPDVKEYAVELFVRPVDLPLVSPGQEVRFLFDGFPAIVFSGWPEASYGTYAGIVSAVESAVSENGKFKVLIKEDLSYRPWPKVLRMGTGANGIALLKNVPIWYELWRNINSFPPDYYQPSKTPQQ